MSFEKPSLIELSNWAIFHAPDAYARATYIIHGELIYSVLHAAWIAAGRPMTLDFKGSRTT